MNELLKINYEAEQPTVSARDLHEALGVASRFSRWFDSNKELFVEGEDYNKCTSSIDDTATDRALLLKFAGTVESGTLAEYGDDGVTQKATVKTGIASKGDAIVPNPVKLKPYRTFLEVDQPVSEFIFRMKQDKYDGVLCALFEADGGAWKMEATERIKKYLESELKEYSDFTVIS